jgi:hypothetical protein
MEDAEFSPEFCSFLQRTIPDVDAAQLLLVFHSDPETWYTAGEAAAKMGPGAREIESARQLEAFASVGMLLREGQRYKYRVNTPFAGFVDTLEKAYGERPVTLVRIIYALRDSGIQSFADAFKLRRKQP